MRTIILLALICITIKGSAQSTLSIERQLAKSIKLTRVPDDYKPLVMLDGETYTGSLSGLRSSSIESVRILDSITAHAVWDGPGLHGAIEITTKQHRIDECMNRLVDFGTGLRNFRAKHPGNKNIVFHLNGIPLNGDRYNIANKLCNIPTRDIIFVRTLDLGDYAIVSVRTKK